MTQTQPNKSSPSVGTAAAQAAAGHATTNKSAETKPVDAKAAATGTGTSTGATTDEQAPTDKKRASKKRVFVAVGEVYEFETVNQAEKFLNGPEAPTGEYAVLRGTRTRTSKRVSLR